MQMIIAGNWKMYKTRAEAIELAQAVVEAVDGEQKKPGGQKELSTAGGGRPQVMLFPPFTSIEYVVTTVKGTEILVGAQNMNQHDSGGFTGEISADMIIDCGARTVLIGHSERRNIFHETDVDVHAKLITAVKRGLIAVLCVGETLEQKEAGETDAVIERQISTALEGVSLSNPDGLIVAYEPVWSIGTGKVCEPEQANRVCGMIRSRLQAASSTQLFADRLPILYGGSVKPGNVAAQLAQPNINGVLVGGASLTAAEFIPIIEAGVQQTAAADHGKTR